MILHCTWQVDDLTHASQKYFFSVTLQARSGLIIYHLFILLANVLQENAKRSLDKRNMQPIREGGYSIKSSLFSVSSYKGFVLRGSEDALELNPGNPRPAVLIQNTDIGLEW